MPGYWDANGNYVSGDIQVRDRLLRIMDSGPSGSPSNGKIVIDGVSEQSLLLNGAPVYLQNVGDSKIYMGNKTGVNADNWEIMPRMRAGPITSKDRLYFMGAGPTTLKFLFVGGT